MCISCFSKYLRTFRLMDCCKLAWLGSHIATGCSKQNITNFSKSNDTLPFPSCGSIFTRLLPVLNPTPKFGGLGFRLCKDTFSELLQSGETNYLSGFAGFCVFFTYPYPPQTSLMIELWLQALKATWRKKVQDVTKRLTHCFSMFFLYFHVFELQGGGRADS